MEAAKSDWPKSSTKSSRSRPRGKIEIDGTGATGRAQQQQHSGSSASSHCSPHYPYHASHQQPCQPLQAKGHILYAPTTSHLMNQPSTHPHPRPRPQGCPGLSRPHQRARSPRFPLRQSPSLADQIDTSTTTMMPYPRSSSAHRSQR